MTSKEFCYFLRGFFEVTGIEVTKKMSEGQVERIKKYLSMVDDLESPMEGTMPVIGTTTITLENRPVDATPVPNRLPASSPNITMAL